MKRIFIVFLLGLISLGFNPVLSQKKYAILIGGEPTIEPADFYVIPPPEEQWMGTAVYDIEFWNDVYLLWEMLYDKYGFSDEDIYVLFGGGTDLPLELGNAVPERYQPQFNFPGEINHITDMPLTTENVMNTIQNLPTGPDDFLFIFVFNHGFRDDAGGGYFYCNNGVIHQGQFGDAIKGTQCAKTVVWMQNCNGGNFGEEFIGQTNSVVFCSAAGPDTLAHRCDDFAKFYYIQSPSNITYEENESWDFISMQNHGEFTYHMYSSSMGQSPSYQIDYNGEPYNGADSNGDGFISIKEAYNWTLGHDSQELASRWNLGIEIPYMVDNECGATTSFAYPTLLCEDLAFPYPTFITAKGLIGISKTITVESGSTLVFYDGAKVLFLNNSHLIVNEGGVLQFGNNVEISGDGDNAIDVHGQIICGNNVKISGMPPVKGDPPPVFGGLDIYSITSLTGFTFSSVDHVTNHAFSFTMENCSFEGAPFQSVYGNVTINNCSFLNSGIYLESNSFEPYLTATIHDNTFSAEYGTGNAIEVYNYPRYTIYYNEISGFANGIMMSYSGSSTQLHQILSNTIYSCTLAGIQVYTTNGIIYDNHINNNYFGVRIHGTSNISLNGNPNAGSSAATQVITNCTSYEVYASQNGFPYYFHYNIIQDNDNSGNPIDPLVYYSNGSAPPDLILDAENNCWGNGFQYDQDLFPYQLFDVDPMWCPGQQPPSGGGAAEDLYNEASTEFTNGNYYDAKNKFVLCVELYPESRFAQSSMKDLLSVEKFAGNDYNGLKDYYLTNDSIVNDSLLAPLGVILANKCDEILGNYQVAINYYEGIIGNPPSAEDSTYAIIDLGHLYFLMEGGGLKSSVIGKLPQYKPKTKEQYLVTKDSLLSLLPYDPKYKYIKEALLVESYGELIQNIPNPVKSKTTIWYRIENTCEVRLQISDITGRVVKEILLGTLERGNRYTEVDLTGITAGTYVYSLIINNHFSDSRKLVVIPN